MKRISKSFKSYEDFALEFEKIFNQIKTETIFINSNKVVKNVFKAPVRTGKTYFCEKSMLSILKDDTKLKQKAITIFLTTKNVLCDESFSSLNCELNEPEKSRLFLMNQETATNNLNRLRGLIDTRINGIVIITTYSYFSGDKISLLYSLISNAKFDYNYKIRFLLDEAEGFLNTFHKKVLISGPVSKQFGRPLIGNNTMALNRRKSKMDLNNEIEYGDCNFIYGKLIARESNLQTFDVYQYSTGERDSSVGYLRVKFETKKVVFKNMSLYHEISSIYLISYNEMVGGDTEIKIFEIDETNRILTPMSNIFNTIELYFTIESPDVFFTLISFIDTILNSSEVYLHHKCVTTNTNRNYPLNYEEARDLYENYKSIKVNNSKFKLSQEINLPMFGKIYEFEFRFVNPMPLVRIGRLADTLFLFSATWNNWLLDTTLDSKPYFLGIKDRKLQYDLVGLINLIKPEDNSISIKRATKFFYGFERDESLNSLLNRFEGLLIKHINSIM